MLILGKEIPIDTMIEVEVVGPRHMIKPDYDALQSYFKHPTLLSGEYGPVYINLDKYLTNRIDDCTIVVDDIEIKGNFRERMGKVLREFFPMLDFHAAIAQVSVYLAGVPSLGKYIVEVHPDVDWNPGEYHEAYESCWWHDSAWSEGRVRFRYACKNGRAFALRYYKVKQDYAGEDYFDPSGRCFCAKLEVDGQECWMVFNAYGPTRHTFGAILATMLKAPTPVYRSVYLDDNIYINENTVPIIASIPEILPERFPFMDFWSEYDWDQELEEEREMYVDEEPEYDNYCEDCGGTDEFVYETYDHEYFCDEHLRYHDYIWSDYHDTYIQLDDCHIIEHINDGEMVVHNSDIYKWTECPECQEVWGDYSDFICPDCKEKLEEEKEDEPEVEGV